MDNKTGLHPDGGIRVVKMKAVLIDDDPVSLKILEKCLNRYCSSLVEVVGKATEIGEGVGLINELRPQLIFLDIVMEGGDSFDILDAVVNYDYKVIFVSAFEKYSIRSFRYNTVDYILKPIRPKRLVYAVNKVCNEMEKQRSFDKMNLEKAVLEFGLRSRRYVSVPSYEKINFVSSDEVVFFKGDGRYTYLYLNDGTELVATKSLGEYESVLRDCFFRVHQSYIINVNYLKLVDKINGCFCVMKNDIVIPVARRRQEAFYDFIDVK